jgi:hypothetical protein
VANLDTGAGGSSPDIPGSDDRQERHEYYGVPLWLMKDYLGQLGAHETAENVMEAAQWRAVLSKAATRRIGSLAVGGTVAEFSGDGAALDAMFAKLHWKTLRGGG